MQPNEKNIVKRTLDLTRRPALTDAQKTRLDAVAAMPDRLIDYSDSPDLGEDAEWTRAADRLPNAKQQITLRIDTDVLKFFRNTGKRYQTRINAVLRSYVEAQHRLTS
ncbi:MAG: BrnA antitoxin family protein [Zoogloeaceae bacterium]|jgi:uncharacterized protein (DUF4415 family)|nr:BrnA antitoxin family protein [Zoogloeaceae bacterium]